MSAYTTSQTGNWSSASTWGGSGPPGNGDTATVNHAVTVDTNTTVGTSPAEGGTAALTIAAALTVATGITLKVRGPVQQNNVGVTLGAGSILEFDASQASTPASQNYKWTMGTTSSSPNARITANGTSGSHVTIRSNAGGGSGYFSYNAGAFVEQCYWTVSYTDFQSISNPANDRAIETLQNNNTGTTNTFDHCTFDSACGALYWVGSTPADSSWVITNNKFQQTVSPCVRIIAVDKGTGTRTITGNAFSNQPALPAGGTTLDDNVLTDGVFWNSSTAQWASCSGNLVYLATTAIATSGMAAQGGMTDCYVVANNANTGGNAHMITVSASATYAFSGLVFDSTMVQPGDDTSDLLYGANGLTQTVTVDNCLILKNGAYGDGAGVINPNSPNWKIRHCTWFETENAGVMLGDLALVAGTVTEFKSNLVVAQTGSGNHLLRYVHFNADPSSSGTANVLTGAGAQYNASYGSALGAGQEGGGYNTYNTDTTPGANDIALGASPGFVDDTRNLGKWAVARGYSSSAMSTAAEVRTAYADGWTACLADPTRVSDLYDWVLAGAAPTNSDLQDAGHDGVTIGAVEGVFTPAGGPFPHYLRGAMSGGMYQMAGGML
jgi:hypothetical protein